MKWDDKYAPTTLDEVVFADDTTRQQFLNFPSSPASVPHLLLHGPYGTGKTTVAQLLPVALNAAPYDIREKNASLNTGIAELKTDVSMTLPAGTFAGYTYGKKVLIYNEVDGLSKPAQRALKGIIDDFGQWYLFIVTTNRFDALDEGVRTRCREYAFNKLDLTQAARRCKNILNAEGVSLPDNELRELIKLHQPNMRLIITELQRAAGR